METPFFEVTGLRKRLGGREVLRGVSFEVPAGRTTVILGGSGVGKSVLLKHLDGLLRPDAGSVRVEGEAIEGLSERALTPVRRRVGILFQHGALFDSMTVGENVAFPLREAGERDEGAIGEAVAGALERVGLAGEEGKMPAELSGGMRRRAALARAMVGHPRCLLCDEPTSGLDPILSRTIASLIRNLTEEERMTSVTVTHDLEVMRSIADRVVFLGREGVLFAGAPAELEATQEPAIREFLDASGGSG